MAPIDGRWVLASSDNLIGYLQAVGAAGDALDRAKVLEVTGAGGPKEEFSFSAGQLTAKLINKDDKVYQETTMKLGQETPTKSLDGRDIKVTISGDGSSFQRQEVGDGYTAQWTRTISGNTMTVVMKAGGATCTRTFNKA